MSRAPQPALQVTIQFAAPRRGVPGPQTLRKWAEAAWCAAASSRQRRIHRYVAVRIVGGAESRKLNRTWRGKDRPTNVLSFPAEGGRPLHPGVAAQMRGPLPLGDLAICAPVVAREAREQDKASRAHWAHMVVHGMLHLLGYDHEDEHEAQQMESKEIRILRDFGYANPYA